MTQIAGPVAQSVDYVLIHTERGLLVLADLSTVRGSRRYGRSMFMGRVVHSGMTSLVSLIIAELKPDLLRVTAKKTLFLSSENSSEGVHRFCGQTVVTSSTPGCWTKSSAVTPRGHRLRCLAEWPPQKANGSRRRDCVACDTVKEPRPCVSPVFVTSSNAHQLTRTALRLAAAATSRLSPLALGRASQGRIPTPRRPR